MFSCPIRNIECLLEDTQASNLVVSPTVFGIMNSSARKKRKERINIML